MKRIRCTLNWIDRGVLATLVFTGITQAEDLTTLTGRTLHEVSYSAPSADSVQVNSREGSERLYLFDLPAEIQRRFSIRSAGGIAPVGGGESGSQGPTFGDARNRRRGTAKGDGRIAGGSGGLGRTSGDPATRLTSAAGQGRPGRRL